MKHAEIVNRLDRYYRMGTSVMLRGHRGVGKTQIIKQIFDKHCPGKYLIFSGATLDPFIDFVGVPKEFKDDKVGESFIDYVLPRFWNGDIEAIFIDEFNRAPVKVRNATLELVQFHSINNRKLDNLKCVWAAINPKNDDLAYDVEEADPAQLDRFPIHIEVPYVADPDFFFEKFQDSGKVAVEWWNRLPKEVKWEVSPRRLEYALEVWKGGGYLEDVLPVKSNPVALLGVLEAGVSVEDQLKEFFANKKAMPAKKFLKSDNIFHAALPIIESEGVEWMKFFGPLFTEEKQAFVFQSGTHPRWNSFILSHSIHFTDMLTAVERVTKDKKLKEAINNALKQNVGQVVHFV